MNHSFGGSVLLFAVLVMLGFAIAGLLGYVQPVTGAAVGLGAIVVGTIAYFLDYFIRNRS